jgi:glutamate-1-semialdehyde 2,1-aminomutase
MKEAPEKINTAADWRARASGLFPGGVQSPVRAQRAVGGDPPVLVQGDGATVWDADGHAFLDCLGAFGPLIIGHAHPRVVAAITTTAAAGGPFAAVSPLEVRLGERIRDAMPAVQKMRFVSSGTEAVMSAVRLARAATGKDLIVKFEGCYHGHADHLLARAGSGLATLSLPDSAGVPAAFAANTLVAPYNDLDAAEALLSAHRDRVAAVVVEPVAANMGVVIPAADFLEGLREGTTRHGALLVFDEVITGFRVAQGGAQGRYGIKPDLTVLGKVIGGGLPVGAYGGGSDLMNQVSPLGPVYQAGTLSGHPIAMAAGEATLAELTPAVYSRLEDVGAAVQQGVEAAARRVRREVSVSRVGSLLTVFFRSQPPRNYAEAKQADAAAFARFFHSMREGGVLLPPSQYEAWFLSAALTDADVSRIADAAGRALSR